MDTVTASFMDMAMAMAMVTVTVDAITAVYVTPAVSMILHPMIKEGVFFMAAVIFTVRH